MCIQAMRAQHEIRWDVTLLLLSDMLTSTHILPSMQWEKLCQYGSPGIISGLMRIWLVCLHHPHQFKTDTRMNWEST